MHRKFLKSKVMAALFSAAFLLGAGDANAAADYDRIIVSKDETIESVDPYGYWVDVTFTGDITDTPTLTVKDTANTAWVISGINFGQTSGKIITEGDINISVDRPAVAIGMADQDSLGKITSSGESHLSGSIVAGGSVTVASDVTMGNLTAQRDITIGGNLTAYGDYVISKNGNITIDGDITGERVSDVSAKGNITIGGNLATNKGSHYTADTITIGGDVGSVSSSNQDIIFYANTIVIEGNIGNVYFNPRSAGSSGRSEELILRKGFLPSVSVTSGATTQNYYANIHALGNVTFETMSPSLQSFRVSQINASIVSVIENLNIQGNLYASAVKPALLNGGLSGGDISDLAAGEISATSTEAVNGAQLYMLKQKGGLSAGEDISISSANAISVNKAGSITADNAGIVSGGAVYSVASAVQTSLAGIASSVSKNQASISSIQDDMSELKSSVANINASVASTTKNLSSSLSNRLQADLGNLSDDGKNVIKNLIAETLRGMSGLTIAVNEVSFAQSNVSSVSIMPTVAAATVDAENGSSAIVSVGDIDGVYASLNGKVGATDFDSLKTDVGKHSTAIEVNAGNIKTNALAIDTLKSSKANVDGSNIDVSKYSEKLSTGKIEAGDTGLVTGGIAYSALDSKADVSYVDAGLGVMSNQLESVKQNVTHDMNRMGANAAALASLHPQNYDSEDKLDFAAGYGHYHDRNATAVGAFYHPNAATMVRLAGTVGNGDSMVSAGLSFKLGMNANVEKGMISKKDFEKQQVENQKMKGYLDNQTARLQQMEATLSAMIHH